MYRTGKNCLPVDSILPVVLQKPYPKPTWFYSKCRVMELLMALTHKSLWSHFQVLSNLRFLKIPSSCSPSHTWDSPVWAGGVQPWSGADQFITHLSMHLECHCSHKAQRRRKIGSAYHFRVLPLLSSVMREEVAAAFAITFSSNGAVPVSCWGLCRISLETQPPFMLSVWKNISSKWVHVGDITQDMQVQGTQRQGA